MAEVWQFAPLAGRIQDIIDKVEFSDDEIKAIVKKEEEEDTFFKKMGEWSQEPAGAAMCLDNDAQVVVGASDADQDVQASPDTKRRRHFFKMSRQMSMDGLLHVVDSDEDVVPPLSYAFADVDAAFQEEPTPDQ
jgi:hypothetical protein